MKESTKETRPDQPAQAERPRTMAMREREIPSVGIKRIGEHYVVHAGCKTEVFHLPSEVEFFLKTLLRDWVRSNLEDDQGAGNYDKTPRGELHAVMTRERI